MAGHRFLVSTPSLPKKIVPESQIQKWIFPFPYTVILRKIHDLNKPPHAGSLSFPPLPST